VTKRKHDNKFYDDLAFIEKSEMYRKEGYLVDVRGSISCYECENSIPLTDNDVFPFFPHAKDCSLRMDGDISRKK